MSGTTEEADELLLELIRSARLEATYSQFPDDVLAAARGAREERRKLEADRTDPP